MMVYIVYRGKDKDNMHKFSVKKIGRVMILAAQHDHSFLCGAAWAVGQMFRYQYLVLRGDF